MEPKDMNELKDTNELKDVKIRCNIIHPLYDILGNSTRREILRLIACERNYGNRLANLLNISSQAVRRHIKSLLDTENEEYSLLTEVGRTHNYSDRKGAEATLYNVNRKTYMSFSLFPNLIHSHIYEQDVKEQYNPESFGQDLDNDARKAEFSKRFNELTKLNEKIYDLEKEVVKTLSKKSEIMNEVDSLLLGVDTLTYDERIILRIITCQGLHCIPDLVDLTWKHESVVLNILDKLRADAWIPEYP